MSQPQRDPPPAGCVEVRLIVPRDYSGSITITATPNQAPAIDASSFDNISSLSPEGTTP